MAKSGFKDPVDTKKGKEQKNPWDFRCPEYDERSSCYVSAGSHNGVGHRNPVGHKDGPKLRAATLPYGRPATMDVAYAPPRQLDQEYIE
jgi:hypothetical protein